MVDMLAAAVMLATVQLHSMAVAVSTAVALTEAGKFPRLSV